MFLNKLCTFVTDKGLIRNLTETEMPFKKGETPKGAQVFEKGISGNPDGRPKGSFSRNTIARKVLSMDIFVPEYLYDHFSKLYPDLPKKMNLEQVATLSVAKRALDDGEYLHYKAIMDSAYGAPKQEVEHSGEVEIGFDIGKISDSDLETILSITTKAKSAITE